MIHNSRTHACLLRILALACIALTLPLGLLHAQLRRAGSPVSTQKNKQEKSDEKAQKREIRITLRSQARVPGRNVLIGDCATLEGIDATLVRSLEAAKLGRAPRGTWSRNVSRADVERTLEERGVDRSALTWRGAKDCTVFAQTVRITSEDMVRAAEAMLRETLEDQGEVDAEWTVETKLRPLLVPRGRRSRRLHASTGPARLAPNAARVRVDILVDEQAWTAVSVAFRIKRFRNAIVAKRAFRQGDPMHAHQVVLQRIDVATRQGELLDSFAQLKGKVAARNIRSGEALVLADMKMPAIVRKRDTVTIVAAVGRVRVARKGIALAAGGRGDRIPVQIEAKKPPLSGEIVAPGLVLVSLAPNTSTRAKSPRASDAKAAPASIPLPRNLRSPIKRP